jgi:hypothetical protein
VAPNTASGKKKKATSYWCVWSEGKWKNTYQPQGAGQPIVLQKTWDPGTQKVGAQSADKVKIAAVDQVILGEEGRVGDWDPITMGRGAQVVAYYVTDSGQAIHSQKGWHLVPWDVSLDKFSIGQPAWPEGEAYALEIVTKFNRQQGAQSLGVVNLDNIWTKVERGGIYNLDVSLQGPDGGISGTVRVVGFSPDELSGAMAIEAEWVG